MKDFFSFFVIVPFMVLVWPLIKIVEFIDSIIKPPTPPKAMNQWQLDELKKQRQANIAGCLLAGLNVAVFIFFWISLAMHEK
jgi:hypothetical protein